MQNMAFWKVKGHLLRDIQNTYFWRLRLFGLVANFAAQNHR